MQDKEYHKNFGRGRNVSCDNFECPNFRKKIGRHRSGWYSRHTICPICHQEGLVHGYSCTVGKDNKMKCDCHLRSLPTYKDVDVKKEMEQMIKDYDIK